MYPNLFLRKAYERLTSLALKSLYLALLSATLMCYSRICSSQKKSTVNLKSSFLEYPEQLKKATFASSKERKLCFYAETATVGEHSTNPSRLCSILLGLSTLKLGSLIR